ncbi:Structural maintenance of chromosomes protein 6 [Entophlyctis luteolus]|nr:Structural maintenance of chromosomes protein 6 [Entophlyctis luteolus]KAJ3392928.1 Structural maintenance of chromosomes protein 6 [Entophlyctis sp. JEL0112]
MPKRLSTTQSDDDDDGDDNNDSDCRGNNLGAEAGAPVLRPIPAHTQTSRPPAQKKHRPKSAKKMTASEVKACDASTDRLSQTRAVVPVHVPPTARSGKSAILTGIMICLGGKADSTDRAKSVKSLVMEGKTAGSVTVHIHNNGPDAFKPEIYGQTIIIERKITREGSGSYKIMDADGVTHCTTRRTLVAILDHMSISIANPLTILTQDTSRQFLANSTPSSKYNFFSNGTLLAALSADHLVMNQCLEEAKTSFKARTALIPDLKKDYDNATERFEEIKRFEGLEDEIVRLQHRIAWAWVEQAEGELHKERDEMELNQKKLDERNESIEKCEETIRLLQERLDVVSQHAAALALQAEPINNRFKEAQRDIVQLKEDRAKFDGDEQQCQRYIRNAEATRDAMDKKIEEETKKLGRDNRQARERKIAEIETFKNEKVEISSKLVELTEQIDRLDSKRISFQKAVAEYHERVEGLKRNLMEEQNARKNLENRDYNRLQAYGVEMARVLQAIKDLDERRMWKSKPVGPLGLFIKLRKPEYRGVIEAVLGSLLKGFVVDNDSDRDRLKRVIADCGGKFMILKQDGRVFHLNGGEPDPEILTFYRAMEISDPVVMRQLVIHRNIEKIALVPSNSDGDRVASSGPNRSMPRNVSSVYTIDNVQIGGRGGALQTRSGLINHRSMPLLGVDVEHEIMEKTRRIHHMQTSLSDLNGEAKVADANARAVASELRDLRNEKANLTSRSVGIESAIKKLEEDLIEEEPASLAIYESKKAEAEKEIEGQILQLQGFQTAKRKINENITAKQQEATDLKRQLDVIKEQSVEKTRETNDIKEEIAKMVRKKEELSARRDEMTTKILELEAGIQQMKQKVDESISKATRVTDGVRIEANGTVHELSMAVARKQAVLKENLGQLSIRELIVHALIQKNSLGTREEVLSNLAAKKKQFDDAIAERDAVKVLLETLSIAIDARVDDWKTLQRSITKKAKNTFTMMMQKRGFNAKLLVDHTKQTLDLRVDVHNLGFSQRADKDKDPRTLSGGEKSFSTVCLLLSLWESMGNPFRALDEFDVFMDAVNRTISMQNMISYARSGDPPCQYIFITPQDMSHVPDLNGRDVQVHRLRDPERNQGRLDFQPV